MSLAHVLHESCMSTNEDGNAGLRPACIPEGIVMLHTLQHDYAAMKQAVLKYAVTGLCCAALCYLAFPVVP